MKIKFKVVIFDVDLRVKLDKKNIGKNILKFILKNLFRYLIRRIFVALIKVIMNQFFYYNIYFLPEGEKYDRYKYLLFRFEVI